MNKYFAGEKACRKAFTLIEILVVIGIVALLLAILLPVLSSVRRRGQLATCTSNLHQLALACDLYSQDNEGVLPRGAWDGVQSWSVVIKPYVKDTGVFRCPAGSVLYSYRNDQLSALYGSSVSLPRVPNLVLLLCVNHLDNAVEPKSGAWTCVREDGSASTVAPTATTSWWYAQGKWYPPGATHPEDYSGTAGGFYVFPAEPWPPTIQ